MGLFSDEKTYSLEPMLTEEQKQAQALLAQLAQTGSIAGINTGDQYGGSLGNYSLSPTTQSAVSSVERLLNSGTPQAFTTAQNTLTNLANTQFNPSDPSSGYAAYARQVANATNQANDVVNRESAITGNRFGDRILNTKRDLALQQSDQLSTQLANLYNTAQNRALEGANGLVNLGNVQNKTALETATTAANLGDMQRLLDTAKAQAQYGEWQRARSERLGAVTGAADSLWGKNVPYGAKNLTTSQQTPWGVLLNAGLGAAGTVIGSQFGGMIGSGVGNLFQTAGSTANGSAGNILKQGVGFNNAYSFGF